MKKRLFSLFLSAALLLSAFSVTNAEDAAADASAGEATGTELSGESGTASIADGFAEVAKGENFSLYFDETRCFIAVEDKRTNMVWYSNPVIENDGLAKGIARTNLKSQLVVNYSTASSTQKVTNSNASCTNSKSFTVTDITNGIRIDYNFKEEKFIIPVTYVIDEEGFTASILFDEIQEYGTNLINTIEFLQYFGAGSTTDTGSIFIPDGNGAMINFNNGKTALSTYSKEFYGEDLSSQSTQSTSEMEKISLPVFGMIHNGGGFLAVVSGAELATLNASVSGVSSSYNQVNTCVTYRQCEKISMLDESSASTDVLYNAIHASTLDAYSVKYHFVDSIETTYNDFVSIYKDVLADQGVTQSENLDNQLTLEIYGGVRKTKSFLGFLYNGREELTSFSDAQAILEDLRASDIDSINVLYQNFSDDTFNRDLQVKLNPSSFLGGKSGFQSLMAYASSQDIAFYPAADFISMPTGGNGFGTFTDVASAINITPIKVYKIALNTNVKDSSRKPYYLLSPEKYAKAVASLLSTAKKQGYGRYYFDEASLSLYSDLSKNGYQREQAKAAMIDSFETLSDTLSVTLSNPNDYLFAYADVITDVPLTSSQNLLFDCEVPFLTSVLKGMVPFTGESVNISDISQKVFLQHIECGANIKYSLTNADSEALLTTDYTFLYAAEYSKLKDQIVSRYAELEAVAAKVGDAEIVNHSKTDGVAVVTYSNGVTVYVNYTDQAVVRDGVTIPANGYVVK